jgi:hypothetical protein
MTTKKYRTNSDSTLYKCSKFSMLWKRKSSVKVTASGTCLPGKAQKSIYHTAALLTAKVLKINQLARMPACTYGNHSTLFPAMQE